LDNKLAKKAGPGDHTIALADELQTAEYICDLVEQLERLARTHGLVRLQFLLATCREEASRVATGR